MDKVKRDFDQGWQGIEYKLNTVGSSRGDYPFVTVTIGLGTERFEKMASVTLLNVHMGGQGKPGNKKPVLFPRSFSCMMKISMDPENVVRMFLKPVWPVRPRPCIRTGCP